MERRMGIIFAHQLQVLDIVRVAKLGDHGQAPVPVFSKHSNPLALKS
jgi:hypothetical protein